MPDSWYGKDVMKKVQALIQERRIRIHEFFRDYDNLRKGSVTATIFERVLNGNLGLNFNSEDMAFIQ